MKKTILENRGKIISYRVYKKVISLRGKRKIEWHSWQLEAESKVRKSMERRISSFKEPGIYRLARKRVGGLEWVYEIAR